MDRYRIPQKLPFSKKRLPKRVIISYILDYAIIIVLFIGFYALDAVEPFHQHFSLSNYTLQYPFAVHERVSLPLLAFVSVVCPAAIIAIYSLVVDGLFSHHTEEASPGGSGRSGRSRYRMKHRLWELNCGILGLLLSEGAAFVITGALKNATGKPRPDFIDRCQPLAGSADAKVYGLSSSTLCNQTNHAILKDGFRSFPSGHSSSAFAGLFYLSLYLAAKLHVLDNRGEVWKTFIVLVPTLGAALIAVSRIMDARHHPFDVLFGSLLGTVVAWCSYRQYFGPISESWRKGRAYPIRTWATEPAGPDSVAVDREVSRHDVVEPLRARSGTDEEQYVPTAETAGPEGAAGPEENVFRQQISQSQRRRQGEANPATWAPAPYRSVPEGRNPFPVGSSTRTQQTRPNDGYWSSSSEDNDEDYELRQQYTLNDPQGQGMHHVGYDTRQEDFDGDTAYHPPAPTTSRSGHPQSAPELHDVGNGRDITSPTSPVRSPPPPHHVGYSRQTENAPRGVDLVETYAK